jgi:hypothetical protein
MKGKGQQRGTNLIEKPDMADKDQDGIMFTPPQE